MTFATRATLILSLVAVTAGAQESATTTAPASTNTSAASSTQPATTTVAAPAPTEEQRSQAIESDQRIREMFTREINTHPPELGKVLVLDPTLLSNEQFLTRYPDIAQFLQQNPQIRRNPHYFLRQLETPRTEYQYRQPSPFEEVVEGLSIAFVFVIIAAALSWIIKTLIDQRRWNQLARRQSEVHNKILDRFSSSEELLSYIKSPAGSKFLESAPIALHTEAPRPAAPQTRVLWTLQIGVIVAAGGLGMLLVAMAFNGESAQGFFAMGMIAFSLGVGFVASAVISMKIAGRVAPWQEPGGPAGTVVDEPGLMR
jgi:hypothetical protein